MKLKTITTIVVSLLVGVTLTIAASQGLSTLDNAISEYCQNHEHN